ncbi:voltage-dependent T-type calcium channel subunit alpha-1G, partial [Asbolus verrucosus]
IGSFFMINLCLVVIATQFSETKKREMERMRLERARFQSSSTLASSTNNSEPTSCYAEIVKYIAHLWRRSKRRLLKKIRLYRVRRDQRRERKMISGETIRLNYAKRHHPNCPRLRQNQPPSVPSTRAVSRTSSMCLSETPRENRGDEAELSKRPSLLRVPSSSNQEISTNNNDVSGVKTNYTRDSRRFQSPTNLLSPPYPPRRRSSVMFSDVIVLHGEDESSPSSSNIDKKNVCSSEKTTQAVVDTFFSSLTKAISNRHRNAEELYIQQLPDDDFSCCQDLWHCESEYKNEKRSRLYIVCCLILKGVIRSVKCVRRKIKRLVEHRYFQQGILLAILINTLSMGIEHHEQPDDLTHVVEISNVIFSTIFAVEMLLKIVADGIFGYISNGFNVFDGVIVVLSGIELFQRFLGQSHTDSGLSVLRTFRLLRILKLVRFMPNLRRQLFVMLRTMDNVAVFFSLLILFIFIFSILGMNLFGCKFCENHDDNKKCLSDQDEDKDRKNFDSLFILGMYLFGGKFCNYRADDGKIKECTCEMIITNDERCECDRKHFNNFLWATVTVFQILTQEDWNVVLSNGMAKTSHWAALYFVALMTFGNYVLFNLLVAILVEGFSSERNERREREQREMARRKMSSMLEGGSLRGSSEETSRSISSSSGSYAQETKNCWRSAEELRKVKDFNEQRSPIGLVNCNCRDKLVEKESCYMMDVQGPIEPKCNIQKESMLRLPSRQTSPPVITHTAATPQDSPSTILDDFPEFRYNVTTVATEYPSASDSSPGGVSSTESTQKASTLSLLKPPTLSPPPLTFRQFERPLDEAQPPLTGKIVTHNEKIGSKIMTFSEKVSIPVKSEPKADKPRIQRKCSWKLASRPSLRRKKSRSGSDSEAVPLNNGRDHSQCNGGGVSRQASLRNDSLLQSSIRIQNDTQRDTPNNRSAKGLSPQNSIRCRSNTYSSVPQVSAAPALTRHNSLATSSVTQSKINTQINKCVSPTLSRKSGQAEPKSVNSLNDKSLPERALPKIKMDDCVSSERESPRMNGIKKLLMLCEPTGCMKEREEYSLYIFPHENRFRQWCHWFVNQKWFDNAILLFIAMNCITLAMERPNIPPYSNERFFLSTCNYIFTVVFTIEMFVKVVASGMCYGPNAYFTSGWNIMDGSLVIISIVDLLMSLISSSSPRIFGILRVFRLLRSLRPLRVINRAPGLKLVVQTLLSSLRPIGNIVLICCTFFIIFGILGVQLFKGSFYYCKGENLTGIVDRNDCITRKYDWENQKYNFDDLGQALMSLFVLSSRDGWVNIMYNGLDAVGVDQQPVINYSEWRLLYFISFILLVGFFVLNMFVGVVVENFHRCREEQEKEERIRRAAKRALQLEKRRRSKACSDQFIFGTNDCCFAEMNEPPYYINYAPWRLFIHNVVTSKYFDLAIAAVIGLNVVTMATESYKMPNILIYVLKIFNYFFTAVFILESAMKVIALGFVLYVKDRWNLLDVAIVKLSVVGIVLEELKSNIIPINPTVLRVMRVMRIARVLKLLKMAKGIRALLDTVMQALPQVGNLGLLFFLLFFIFAALGVELFGRLDCDINDCQGLGEHAHFKNFGMAFLTLFRVATGDNWNGIMKDTLSDENCDDSADCVTNCCISKIIAPIFFVIFVLMAQFVLVNVVVAVLMKHLEESHKHLEDEQDMDNQLEREFQEKQEMEEKRELCLALQMDQECQRKHKPLTKVLSLPSNFTYNPPGTKATLERKPSFTQTRRQTLHSHQPITLLNMDDIRNIDESVSDIYSIQEYRSSDLLEKNHRQQMQTNLDEIISLSQNEGLLKVPKSEERFPLKRINETNENNRLTVPAEPKPKFYGSTKHLFARQKSMDITEETPFLQSTQGQIEK